MSVVSFEILRISKHDQPRAFPGILPIDCADIVYSQDECSRVGFEPAGGPGCPSPGRKRQPRWAEDRTLATSDESCPRQTARLAWRSVTREDRWAYAADPARSVHEAPSAGCARARARGVCQRLFCTCIQHSHFP